MQWILQPFEDTEKLAHALDRLGLAYTWHKVVPFVGALEPEPAIRDPKSVLLFGSYTLWRYAERHDLKPGVFRIAPFAREGVWAPYLLNGPDGLFLTVSELPEALAGADRDYFVRPVEDSKEIAGSVQASSDLVARAQKVLRLDPEEIPRGSLRPDTELMLCAPRRILKEWRVWIVEGSVVTYSLYKEGARVVYRPEIDADAYAFACELAAQNPDYAQAYVLDICRTEDGLRMLETNCVNAAGFYAADLVKLAARLDAIEVQA